MSGESSNACAHLADGVLRDACLRARAVLRLDGVPGTATGKIGRVAVREIAADLGK
ncbi:hypothetical protein Misp01_16130 [Microtetraspora sp. NBRC 13810]|nr:hypothetical protein Misp01_16130 [Microtetraspora sp. NBRC 13810]